MCPACLATVALPVVGATSMGALGALLVRKLPARKGSKKSPRPPEDRAMDCPRVESTQGE